jgi:hypothetical protein
MRTHGDDLDQEPPEEKKPIPVKDLEWYETIRVLLEPYSPAFSEKESTIAYTSAELIQAIEEHHGIPQGPVCKTIHIYVQESDFLRAMKYLGFRQTNTGGLQLQWLMKPKPSPSCP